MQDMLQALMPPGTDPKERAFFVGLPADDETTPALFNSIRVLHGVVSCPHPTVVMPGQCFYCFTASGSSSLKMAETDHSIFPSIPFADGGTFISHFYPTGV